MSSVYTKHLASVSNSSVEVDVVVPAGLVWVIKCIDAANRSGASTDVLAVADAIGVIFWYVDPVSPAMTRWFQWQGTQAFSAGETLRIAPQAGRWDVRVSGYSFSA
jgi:hypothetical protein